MTHNSTEKPKASLYLAFGAWVMAAINVHPGIASVITVLLTGAAIFGTRLIARREGRDDH